MARLRALPSHPAGALSRVPCIFSLRSTDVFARFPPLLMNSSLNTDVLLVDGAEAQVPHRPGCLPGGAKNQLISSTRVHPESRLQRGSHAPDPRFPAPSRRQ